MLIIIDDYHDQRKLIPKIWMEEFVLYSLQILRYCYVLRIECSRENGREKWCSWFLLMFIEDQFQSLFFIVERFILGLLVKCAWLHRLSIECCRGWWGEGWWTEGAWWVQGATWLLQATIWLVRQCTLFFLQIIF